MSGIGSLNETALHADLKEWYRRPGDEVEAPVEGFVADLLRRHPGRRPELIEIQTASFGSMGRKLDALLDRYAVRMVHPVALQRWIVKLDEGGQQLSRRRSPKRGVPADVCTELVTIPTLLSHPRFTLELALVGADELRQHVPGQRRRGGWTVVGRRLVSVEATLTLRRAEDLWRLVPGPLPPVFTTRELAAAIQRPRALAQKLAYCLRMAEQVEVVGRSRAGVQYRRRPQGRPPARS